MSQAQQEINHRHDAFWAHAQAATKSVTPTKPVKPTLVNAIGEDDYTDADYTDIPPSTATEEFEAAEKGYKWFGLKRSTWANLIISSTLVALAGWNIDKLDNISKALFTSGSDSVEDTAASPVEKVEIQGAKITQTASGDLEVIVNPAATVDSGASEAQDFDFQGADVSSLDKVAQIVAAANNPILEQELEAAYSSDPWGKHNLAYYMSFEMHGLTLDKQLVLDLYAEAAAQGHQPSIDNYAVLSDMWDMTSSYYDNSVYAETTEDVVVDNTAVEVLAQNNNSLNDTYIDYTQSTSDYSPNVVTASSLLPVTESASASTSPLIGTINVTGSVFLNGELDFNYTLNKDMVEAGVEGLVLIKDMRDPRQPQMIYRWLEFDANVDADSVMHYVITGNDVDGIYETEQDLNQGIYFFLNEVDDRYHSSKLAQNPWDGYFLARQAGNIEAAEQWAKKGRAWDEARAVQAQKDNEVAHQMASYEESERAYAEAGVFDLNRISAEKAYAERQDGAKDTFQTASTASPFGADFECIDYTCDNSLSETDFRVAEQLRTPSPSNS